jgi:hypothetical protein
VQSHEAFWTVVGTAAPVFVVATVVLYNQLVALNRRAQEESAQARERTARFIDWLVRTVDPDDLPEGTFLADLTPPGALKSLEAGWRANDTRTARNILVASLACESLAFAAALFALGTNADLGSVGRYVFGTLTLVGLVLLFPAGWRTFMLAESERPLALAVRGRNQRAEQEPRGRKNTQPSDRDSTIPPEHGTDQPT